MALSMVPSLDDSMNWFSANLAGDICLREALLEILHNPNTGLPKDGIQLYQRMQIFKTNYEQKLEKVIHKSQWDKICSPSGVSNSDYWDITIIKVIIQYEKVLPPPTGGWKIKSPATHDVSQAAFVCRAKDIRNELKHGTVQELADATTFDDVMRRIEDVLNALGYSKIHVFNDLKTCHLEAYTGQKVKLLKQTLSDMQDDIDELKQTKANVSSYKTKLNELEETIYAFCSQLKDTATKSEIYELLTMVSKQQKEIESIQQSLKRLRDNQDDLTESHKKMKTELDDLKKTKQTKISSEDIKLSFDEHRKQMLELYSQQIVHDPIMETMGKSYRSKKREEVFVDLAIAPQQLYEEDQMKYSECDKYLQRHSLLTRNISIKELVQNKNDHVLVEGIAGIGKTQLIDTIILKWAKGEILNGADGMPDINLLLPIKCRELNTRNISAGDTNESIVKKLYPDMFKKISLEDLEGKSYKVMFIIDGLDELLSVEQIQQPNKVDNPHQNRILHFIRRIMVQKGGILTNQYTMVAGRPTVINSIIKILLDGRIPFHKVQVCGFNKENVEEYIRKHCDPPVQKKVTEEIKSSAYLSAMSQIPVYLWVICNIYKADLTIRTPRTTTELMIYACLVFIRNHLLDSNTDMKELSLQEICEREDVLKLILSVAKISFTSLTEGKVIFESQEMKQLNCNVDELERKLGFIIKTRNGESGYSYQFTHLVLQEFFAAIHIFVSNDLVPIISLLPREEDWRPIKRSPIKRCITYTRMNVLNSDTSVIPFLRLEDYNGQFEKVCVRNIDVCFSIICGLEGMHTSSSEITQLFVKKIKESTGRKDYVELSLIKQIHKLFFLGHHVSEPNHRIDLENEEDYLRCCFENGCELPLDVVDMLNRVGSVGIDFSLSVNFNVRVALHFLQKLSVHLEPLDDCFEKILSKINSIRDSIQGINCMNCTFTVNIHPPSKFCSFNCNISTSEEYTKLSK